MSSNDALLTFPCEFHLKVMGQNTPQFEASVIMIARKHIPNLSETAVSQRASAQHHYVSLTIHFQAQSRAQLEALYHDLRAQPQVLMAL
ncbi:MAG: DUF493 domain-containing protein [Gammaproteobacteria bacterium]|nr:DUF493 domain-containing protein [Gammaproteobacteria bacterium]